MPDRIEASREGPFQACALGLPVQTVVLTVLAELTAQGLTALRRGSALAAGVLVRHGRLLGRGEAGGARKER